MKKKPLKELIEEQRQVEAMGRDSIRAPKCHQLKIKKINFKHIFHGSKRCEVRKNDRDYREGDFLLLHEIEDGSLTGFYEMVEVTHMETFKKQKNYVVLSFRVMK